MTVSYQYDVASSTSGGFTRLLFKWKGSLYKLIYKELFLFCIAYLTLSCVYRFVMTKDQRRTFEEIATYCTGSLNFIPLSFILGFYVSFVASRWWAQYMAIPWPDKLIHAIALHVTGYDEKSRMMRRTLARYINLSLVLILRSISSPLKKRFPTLDHLVDAGFMTTTELGIYKLVPNKEFNTYWVPCTWFTSLLKDIKAQQRIPDPMGIKHIMEEFLEFRNKCGLLWQYDWVSIPLVYTQVVTIATYSFFMAALIGRQFTETNRYIPYDVYFPFFTILQFFVYMGLLKVAEQLINPFGDDDEDFELNWIIDRHMKVSYLIVDTLLLRTPPLSKDIFYDDESPVLPYTEASAEFKKKTYRGSVANMIIPEEKQTLILPDIQEEEYEDNTAPSLPSSIPPTPRSSLNNFGGKESRSVSVGEESVGLGAPSPPRCPPSPSPRVSRRGSNGAGTTAAVAGQMTRSSNRRLATAGSMGIGGALLAVGTHQGFLAAGSEKVNQMSDTGNTTPTTTLSALPPQYSDESRSQGRTDSFCMDMGSFDTDDEKDKPDRPRVRSFRLPASIKARLAVRKKPVITWRPFIRPPIVSQDSQDLPDLPMRFPEGVNPQFLDDVKVNLPKDMVCPGCFEDECAFMWRTIQDDSDSINTNSAPDDDQDDYSSHSHQCKTMSNPQLAQPSVRSNRTLSQHPLYLSQYLTAPHSTSTQSQYYDPLASACSTPSKPPRVFVEEFGPPWYLRPPPRFVPRKSGLKRARYKTKSRMRCLACSMPLLPNPHRGATSRPSLPALVRSLSESSIFLEAVARRLSDHRPTRAQQSTRQSPRLKRQHLSLPISPLSKPALNGRRGYKNSPSPETQ